MNILGEKGDIFSIKADVAVLPVLGGKSFDAAILVSVLPESARAVALRTLKNIEFAGKAG
ncbi:MAG: hypothetical protein AAB839_00180 [Patescibacteria group bacterium]